jgi:phosphoribosylaminoimidazolecarboxamide formyltransferase / IMP cyclohydrolase
MNKRWALLSVTDKNGLTPFAVSLKEVGFSLVSSGGTASHLRAAGIEVTDVDTLTGWPEMFGGRVKTLHPKIHGGILFDRDSADDRRLALEHEIPDIQLVCVNLYDFVGQAVTQKKTPLEAIHHVDIGGPAMIRAAAKNFKSVTVVVDPTDYSRIAAALSSPTSLLALRQELATKAFAHTARYDAIVSSYFQQFLESNALPEQIVLPLTQVQELRYGENPQQQAAVYQHALTLGDQALGRVLQGKELSYNNILDLGAAWDLAQDLHSLENAPACVIVKHNNPCGASALPHASPADAFRLALANDPKSAFGGIVALSATVDEELAHELNKLFLEVVVAPKYAPGALAILAKKANLRVVEQPCLPRRVDWRTVGPLFLAQEADLAVPKPQAAWTVASQQKLADEDLKELAFAMTVAKHVKSNAIVLTQGRATLGIGAGQMSRIDAMECAFRKAKEFNHLRPGLYLASDAFFPFADSVEMAATHGIKAIVQPGGSKNDPEVIAAADKHQVGLVLTGVRHFRH